MKLALLFLAMVTPPKPIIIFPDGSALYRIPHQPRTICTSHLHHEPTCYRNGKLIKPKEKK
jgi:hypothetical protein